MSVHITLTETQMPPSEQFLGFVDAWLSGAEFDGSNWASFGQERPQRLGRGLSGSASTQLQQRVADSATGMSLLRRAYELFVALLIGDVDAIRAVQQQFRFALVVGAPRSGGKYLTKEMFRALGHIPNRVPAVIAHDGFPEAGPWRFDRSGTTWLESLHSMAEYLAMVELFFVAADRHEGRIVVPKKATKAVYAPGLFQSVLGDDMDGIITIRHPVPACISTYEASGGLPADQRFVQRGNIEHLWARDLMSAGITARELADMNYFDAYLRYWEDYYVRVSLDGAKIARYYRVVAYGAERFVREAQGNANRFGSSRVVEVEEFHVQDRRDYHPEWLARAEPALRRVSEQWARVGLAFPLEEIAECW
ncbi:hypothetical protein B0G81_7889 [Paraburkholderia sp. BL6665CI2N2]|uniref:hypothetical protein n=1 Tax=Paraburkholderia sp. BL6665CI2N2 TaxID=1938806 RepID=UPI001066EE40|nr:hypothetical protein [Paraburkholderia sp. BL6665CI2N2]TDY16779.1 hypothetical protein B0G81_7889 [Paraburkholderia sp. BL6665CI2N2]